MTLVEALVAMAVMAFGMLALVGVQRTIAINADISRQVAEATRATASEMAGLRSYVTLDNVPVTSLGPGGAGTWRSSWASLGDVAPVAVALPAGTANTLFMLETAVRVDELVPPALASNVEAPRMKLAAVTTRWSDRSGGARDVSALGIYAAVDTALSARVVMATPPTPAVQNGGRSVEVPLGSTDLGNGTSAFKPFANPSGEVWIIGRDSGLVTSVCTGVAAAQPAIGSATISAASCTAVAGDAFIVSGTVRFDQRVIGGSVLGTELARDPLGPALPLSSSQPLRMVPGTDQNVAVPPSCFAGPPYAVPGGVMTSAVDYACLIVKTPGSRGWGGRLELEPGPGWGISGATGNRRVCRYTPLVSDHGANSLHPRSYCYTSASDPSVCVEPVRSNLLNQNYLVISDVNSCPVDTAAVLPSAGVALGDYVNTNTRAHQPWP